MKTNKLIIVGYGLAIICFLFFILFYNNDTFKTVNNVVIITGCLITILTFLYGIYNDKVENQK